MSDEIETNIRATNATIQAEIVALRERLDLIWKTHEREHTQHEQAHQREHAFSQTAIDTAATLAKENKADANEWRASMTDREARFSTKADVEAILGRLDKIERVQLVSASEQQSADRRQARAQWTIALIVGTLATIGAVAVNTILRLSGS